MMDLTQMAGLAGTFIGAVATTVFSRRAKKSADKVRSEVEGPGDEPSLRTILLDHAQATAREFAQIHKDSGAILHRIDKLETSVGKLDKLEAARKAKS